MLLLGTNAIILLHTRRAMAEGALLFGVTFFLWSLPKADRRPWLAGLSAAVAFSAKQSALALFPAGLLAACWLTHSARSKPGRIGWNAVQYTVSFAILTLALNPLLWSNPIQAARASWLARQELLHRQVSEVGEAMPEQLLQSPGERFAVMLANVYIMPPAFAEMGNYVKDTAAAEAAYLAVPGNNLMRGGVGGGLLLFLTLCGLILAAIHTIRTGASQRRELILVMSANLFQAAFILMAVPLSWQRYIILLIPFVCIWSSYGLSNLLHSSLIKNANS